MRVKPTWRGRKIFLLGIWDYDGALAELKIARRTLPNDFRIPQMTAQIQKRLGHLEDSTRNLSARFSSTRATSTKSGDCNVLHHPCGVMLT